MRSFPSLLCTFTLFTAASAFAADYTVTKLKHTLAAGSPLELAVDPTLMASCAQWDCTLVISAKYGDKVNHAVLSIDGEGRYRIEQRTGDEKAEKAEAKAREPEAKKVKDAKKAKADADKKAQAEAAKQAKAAATEGETAAPAESPKKDEPWMSKPILSKEERIKVSRERSRQGKLHGGYLPESWEAPAADEGVPSIDWTKPPEGFTPPEGFERRLGEGAEPKVTYVKIRKAEGTVQDGKLQIAADLLPEGDFYIWTNGYWGASLDGKSVGRPNKTGGAKIER